MRKNIEGIMEHYKTNDPTFLKLNLRRKITRLKNFQTFINTLQEHPNTNCKCLDISHNQIGIHRERCKTFVYVFLRMNNATIDNNNSRSRRESSSEEEKNNSQRNNRITHVNLFGNEIGTVPADHCIGASHIIEAVHTEEPSSSESCIEVMNALCSNTTITNLDLGLNQLGDNGCKLLADVLRTNKTLTSLDLFDNQITKIGISYIADALTIQTEEQEQDTKQPAIRTTTTPAQEESAAAVVVDDTNQEPLPSQSTVEGDPPSNTEVLPIETKNEPVVKKFDFQYFMSYITDAFLTFTAPTTKLQQQQQEYQDTKQPSEEETADENDTLPTETKKGPVLKKLDLQYNPIGNKGCVAISNMLFRNNTLTHLSLRCNQIGYEGIESLSNVLSQQQQQQSSLQHEVVVVPNYCSLTHLNLYGNLISMDGCIVLSKAIETNQTLLYLNLYGNQIENDGFLSICNALCTNTTLKHLNISLNHIQLIHAKNNNYIATNTTTNATIGNVTSHKMTKLMASTKLLTYSLMLMIRKNKSITKLELADNYIGNYGCVVIANAVFGGDEILEEEKDKVEDAKGPKRDNNEGEAPSQPQQELHNQEVGYNDTNNNNNNTGNDRDDEAIAKSLAMETSEAATHTICCVDIHTNHSLCFQQLQYLDLTGNHIDDEGCIAIAKAFLSHNNSNTTSGGCFLTHLLLNNNNITHVGGKEILKSLEIYNNTSLIILGLDDNPIDYCYQQYKQQQQLLKNQQQEQQYEEDNDNEIYNDNDHTTDNIDDDNVNNFDDSNIFEWTPTTRTAANSDYSNHIILLPSITSINDDDTEHSNNILSILIVNKLEFYLKLNSIGRGLIFNNNNNNNNNFSDNDTNKDNDSYDDENLNDEYDDDDNISIDYKKKMKYNCNNFDDEFFIENILLKVKDDLNCFLYFLLCEPDICLRCY